MPERKVSHLGKQLKPQETIVKAINEFNQHVETNIDENVSILTSKVISMFKNKEVSSSNWMNLVTLVVQSVDDIKDLNGYDKKDLALDIIDSSVKHLNITDNNISKALLSRESLDNTIDLLISASKGQLDLNKIKNFTISLCISSFNKKKYEPIIDINNINSNLEFYDELIKDFKNKEINISNWMSIVTRVMQDVEKLKTLSGPEKKDLTIQITVKIFKNLNLKDDTLSQLYSH